ncbi:hypothetical protein OAS19_04015 [Altererythrobacter sp.]|nr:hypothetical protein [Altererythrobacter sp.]
MKNYVIGSLAALTALSFTAAAATAQLPAEEAAPAKAEIVERNAQGKATKVKIGDDIIPVCMNYEMTDGCINPREAGLNWGNFPANTFKDKPAKK